MSDVDRLGLRRCREWRDRNFGEPGSTQSREPGGDGFELILDRLLCSTILRASVRETVDGKK